MKNYIGFNIKYLCDRNFLSQDEFGDKFGLKKSVIGTYIREISQPKIETIQKICLEFKISIDDFINRPLDQLRGLDSLLKPHYGIKEENRNYEGDLVQKEQENKLIKLLEETVNDKKKIIEALEKELLQLKSGDENSKAV